MFDKHTLNLNLLLETSKKLNEFAARYPYTLLCVRVSPLNKGVPFPQTTLCLPTSKDVAKLEEDSNNLLNKGIQDCVGPKEPKHWDPYRKERFVTIMYIHFDT